MLPFTVELRAGHSIVEQVVYAATRAVVTGQLRPGDPFPSVRALSQALRINPNTAHKIVSLLVDQGVLVVRPGTGTEVAALRPAGTAARRAVLDDQAERLVVEGKRVGLTLAELLAAVRRHWARAMSPAG